MSKTRLKDVLNVTVTESKKSVKNLTGRQVDNLVTKLQKLLKIVSDESNIRYKKALEEELDRELEEEMLNWSDDEVQE